MTVWYKQGVIGDLQIPAQKAVRKVHAIYYREYACDLMITSLCEGNHSAGSLHYIGQAFDCRYPNGVGQGKAITTNLVGKIKEQLGKHYDVVAEGNHLHVEYDPK